MIKIKDHEESYIVDKQKAIEVSLYIESAMSGSWANARTGIIELEKSDYATPETVGLFTEYVKYLVDLPHSEDPLNELEEFGTLANFWLFADFLQSRKITKAVMKEFEEKAEDIELMDADMFNTWWDALKDQPSFDMLRGMMLALLVASETFKEKDSRHEFMRALSPAAQEAVVDELMRQHKDVHKEVEVGAQRLEEYIDDDEGLDELTSLRKKATTKVVAKDFYKVYNS